MGQDRDPISGPFAGLKFEKLCEVTFVSYLNQLSGNYQEYESLLNAFPRIAMHIVESEMCALVTIGSF